MKIKDDNTRGVVLSRNTTNYITFPRYNSAATDLFNDYANLTGSILYNLNDDQYYKYDGFAWNPARQVQAIYNPRGSRVGATSGFAQVCISFGVGFCLSSNPPQFKMADDKSAVLVDNLGIKDNSTYAYISKSGIYDIVAAIRVQGLNLGATVGITEYRLSLQANSANGWQTVAQKKSYAVVLIIGGGGGDTSFAHTMYLPAGTQLRVVPDINSTAVSAGALGGASTDLDPIRTYLGVRLVREM